MGSTGDGATPNTSEQYGTQDNPARVTGQFLNGRGPDEVRKWASTLCACSCPPHMT